jgi:hypothetical protein
VRNERGIDLINLSQFTVDNYFRNSFSSTSRVGNNCPSRSLLGWSCFRLKVRKVKKTLQLSKGLGTTCGANQKKGGLWRCMANRVQGAAR